MGELLAYTLSGVIIIICGFLVKRFPKLIAGYNTMPAGQKKSIETKGLSSFMQKHLVIVGFVTIILGILLYLTEGNNIVLIIYVVYPFVHLLWMVIRAQRYNYNKR